MIIGEIRIFVTGAEMFSGDKKFGGGCYEKIFVGDVADGLSVVRDKFF